MTVDLLADFDTARRHAEAVKSGYAAWARDNCGNSHGGSVSNPTPDSELGRWVSFRDQILRGARPSAPAMATETGRTLAAIGVLYLDATAPDEPPPSQGVDASGRFFTGSDSINPAWFEPIAANPKLSPNSAALVQQWVADSQKSGPPPVSLQSYTVPIFKATANDPKYDVHIDQYPPPSGKRTVKNVPIPAGATPSPGSDMHLCIETDSCLYDFWKMRHQSTGWVAGAAIVYPKPSNGSFPNAGCRASGIPLPLGAITASDIMRGEIKHALAFTSQRQGNKVLRPDKGGGCMTTGGSDSSSLAVHCGVRIQLDPSLNLDGIAGLPQQQKIVLKGLQVYGAFMVDGGGGALAFQAVNEGLWPQVGLPQTYWYLDKLPLGSLRVLDYAGVVPTPAQTDYVNACAQWGP